MIRDKALLDTCVLVPIRQTSVLMYAAVSELYAPVWSERILDSVVKYVPEVHGGRVTAEDVAKRVKQMTAVFKDALVTGHEHLIAVMDCDEGDRHVLAAAVHARADILVTENLKHFPKPVMQRHGIAAVSTDNFLLDLLEAFPAETADAVVKAITAGVILARQHRIS